MLDKPAISQENEASYEGVGDAPAALTTNPVERGDTAMAESKSTRKLLAEWFWTDRWMGSSAFLLPLEPRGLYREMLTQAWNRGAQLPNNHEAIRRAIGATPGEWRRCWPKVERYWRVDGDCLVNDTQLVVYAEARAAIEKASERGKKGAQATAQARAQALAQVGAQAPTQVQHEHVLKSQPLSLSPIPEHTERVPVRTHTRGEGPGVGSFPRDHLSHAWCGRVCVPGFLHQQFVASLGFPDADEKLRAFYGATLDAIPGPIGDDPVKFWRARVAVKWPAPNANAVTTARVPVFQTGWAKECHELHGSECENVKVHTARLEREGV